LQELITARPYMPNQQLQGFSLNPARGHEDMFRQLGLETGDILIQFNGVPLTDQSQGMTMMQQLLTSRQVDLRILRGGTERALTLILRAP
jgi:type II secretion system protein C